MKTRIFKIFIMVAALAMFAPVAEAGLYKVAGGGVIEYTDNTGTEGEATLAISARLDGYEFSGNVLYINRDTKFKFHGPMFSITIIEDASSITILGVSKGGESITITIIHGGDEVIDAEDTITIWSEEGMNFGNLVRGNIKLFFD